MLLPEAVCDDVVPLTTAQAAEAFGVTPAAIRRWVRIGYLKPMVTSKRGRSIFEFTDVAKAEKLAWEAAIRTSGSDARVQRNIPA